MKTLIGIKVGLMQLNFAMERTKAERQAELKLYRSFYANKKDSKGLKVKVEPIYEISGK